MRKAIGQIKYPEVQPGTRAFVVGNGPSLTPEQLERIQGEVSFGTNRIHLMYPRTQWRPTYWLMMDLDSKPVYREDIQLHAQQGYGCYVRLDIMARWLSSWIGLKSPEEIVEVLAHIDTLDSVNHINTTTRELRDPLADGKYNQGGSVGGALQLALAFGYDPVYMIGCDGGLQNGRVNHFTSFYDPDHATDQRTPEHISNANKMLDAMHTVMHREYILRGKRLYNATPGSVIVGTPSIEFDSLF